MNRERLERLRGILTDFQPPRDFRFDMGFFYLKHQCETVGCALGYAAMDPEFNRQGLKVVLDCADRSNIQFENYLGFKAGREFFGLSDSQTTYLFSSFTYPTSAATPHDVADRITELLEEALDEAPSQN